uniref:HAD family hydrolase n=1 Tax=Ascaris lumbricoides TaxID=6252 RepID=A0A0M3HSP5_ASCLU
MLRESSQRGEPADTCKARGLRAAIFVGERACTERHLREDVLSVSLLADMQLWGIIDHRATVSTFTSAAR